MSKRKTQWPKNWIDKWNLEWPLIWSNEQGTCIQCEHGPSEHNLVKGGDGLYRIFCRGCPSPRTRLMGDEGTEHPTPFFVELPGAPTACFEERQVSRKIDNFLPLSPGTPGEGRSFTISRQATTGEETETLRFTGIAWQAEEFEQLKHGDQVDTNRYKLHLYWLQEGICAGCPRRMFLDLMEIDRIIPGDEGPGYTVGNVQLLCSQCNKIKNNRSMDDLLARRSSQGLQQIQATSRGGEVSKRGDSLA